MIKPFRIYKILILFILILSLSSCKNSKTENDINGEDIVYICTGRLSKAYHTYEDCYGLNRCSGELRKIKVKQKLCVDTFVHFAEIDKL